MAELIVDGRIPTHDEWRREFDAFMADATRNYRDVLEKLWACEIPALMTQTGGRCLAIEIPGPNHTHFLLTDQEDALSFDRDEDQGWALGYYDDECEYLWNDAITRDTKTADSALELVLEGLHRIREGTP